MGRRPAGRRPAAAGTPQYDAYMKERERKRLLPAADREKEEQAQKGATGPRRAARCAEG
jgi:hypothetical protein